MRARRRFAATAAASARLVARRAVPGHSFGLARSADDKAALIAVLKTL
jgi:hypothetical protein